MLVVVGLEDEGGSITLFACSTCRGAVLAPSIGEGDKASGELRGCVERGRGVESGRWLARVQNGYDDGLNRIEVRVSVEAENVVGATSVP